MDIQDRFAWTQFRDRLSAPSLWIEKADQLVSAARLLEPSITSYWDKVSADHMYTGSCKQEPASNTTHYPFPQDVFLMLVAYALENYFKAAILCHPKHGDTIAAAQFPEEAKGHYLDSLARNAGFKIDKCKRDKFFLQKLREYSVWRGRYPAPIDYSGLAEGHVIKGIDDLNSVLKPSEILIAKDLIDRVRTYVKGSQLPKSP